MIDPEKAFNAIFEVFSQNENIDDFVLAAAEYVALRGALKNPENKSRYIQLSEDIANFREVDAAWTHNSDKFED